MPTTECSRTKDSQRKQDRADRVAESEVTDMYENIHDWYHDLPDDDRESIEGERRVRAEGRIRHKGEDGQEEVRDAEDSAHYYEDDRHPLIYSSEIYNDAREEQEDRRVKECREESDEGVNVQPLECHKSDMSLASAKEAYDRVRTAVILREPTFTNDGTETGTKTGEEASEPKTIDCNRRIGGSVGDSRVGYVCQLWVAAVQQLVKEQSRLSLIVWF